MFSLASISGGTDIISCFVLGNPEGAVRRGEIPGARARMAVDIFDDRGNSRPPARQANSCARGPSLPCRWDSGTTTTAAFTTRLISTGLTTSGGTVTGPRSRLPGGAVIHGRSDHRAQSRRRAHRHRRDLPPGGHFRGNPGEPRRRPGSRRRCPHHSLRGHATRP